MGAASWSDQRFLSEVNGLFIGSLSEEDQERAWALYKAGHARVTWNLLGLAKIERIPVSYGDGKKSPYGVTYADQVNDDIFGDQS